MRSRRKEGEETQKKTHSKNRIDLDIIKKKEMVIMPRTKGSKNRVKKSVVQEVKDLQTVEGITDKIAEIEAEINELNDSLKKKKLELKALQKAKVVAEKTAAKKKAEEDKAAILAAVEKSGKSVDEVLEFLQK